MKAPASSLAGGGANIKGAILQVGGVLYVSAPDNAWAIDARDGRELWHYFWKTKGGTHIGSRGVGMWNNYLFFETPDNYLVSLDAQTGKERWHVEIADFNQQYFSTMAPIVIGNHVLVGTGNDLDAPGLPAVVRSGDRQAAVEVLHRADESGRSRPRHLAEPRGGAPRRRPGRGSPASTIPKRSCTSSAPATRRPATRASGRKGDNLFTCSLVAVNVETGKMAWYYQTSPHDTHDWDSAQTPMLIDGDIDGKPRKLVSTASRNGYFFTVDRVNGEHIATSKYGTTTNWAKGLRQKGARAESRQGSHHSRVARVAGRRRRHQLAAAGVFAGHRSVLHAENNGFNILYLTDPDPRGSMGLGGKLSRGVGSSPSYLTAIDSKTGKIAWRHQYPGAIGRRRSAGLLATAGKLLFAGDEGGNFVALDRQTASRCGTRASAASRTRPQTYMSTASNTCSSPSATRSTRSRSY